MPSPGSQAGPAHHQGPARQGGSLVRHVLRTFRFVALAALVLLGAGVANAGSYTRIQILLPGETAAPGTPSGKTGTPRAQTAGVPFTIAVNACDDTWTPVTSVTNVVQILASDASATLPAPASLAAGAASFTVTLNAAGSFTLYAHDQTDGTVPDGVSANLQTLVIQSFTFSTINQKNQTVGVPFTVTLTARDANGALVSGYSGWVRLKEITSYGDGRVLPDSVQLAGGTWTGGLACTRADETSINRGNVNFYAFLSNAPGKNGTSDPFTEHPGPFTRVQIVAPGQSPLPGSSSGLVGAPASQSAGLAFTVNVFATDDWWNPVLSADNVRVTSSDAAASTPVSGALVNGAHAFAVTLNTVATQTLSVGDVPNPGILSMTSAGILVIPSGADHFAFSAIPTPQVAGTQVLVTIRAVDSGNNTVPGYDGDVNLAANTGAGSIGPERVTLANGSWTGLVSLRGAGANVTLTASDFSSPAHIGQRNGFVVQPGAFAGLQVLVPGETAQGGTADGRAGTPSGQIAGSPFTLTLRAVDAWWNLVSTVGDAVALGATDGFAGVRAEPPLVSGQLLLPVRLFKTGAQRIWAQDVTTPVAHADTSSAFTVTGGSFAKGLVPAPGEAPAPGTASGRTGVATDQSINYAFTVTVLATDSWWNPVGGVADVVHLGSDDPLATLGSDQAMVDGRADMSVRLVRGGYDQDSVSHATNPSRTRTTPHARGRAVHGDREGHERRRQRDPGDQLVRLARGPERLVARRRPRHAAHDPVPAPPGAAERVRDVHVLRAHRDPRPRRRGERARDLERHHDRPRPAGGDPHVEQSDLGRRESPRERRGPARGRVRERHPRREREFLARLRHRPARRRGHGDGGRRHRARRLPEPAPARVGPRPRERVRARRRLRPAGGVRRPERGRRHDDELPEPVPPAPRAHDAGVEARRPGGRERADLHPDR